MKRILVILLAVSLLANGAFGVWVALRPRPAARPEPLATTVADAPAPAAPEPAVWVRREGESVRDFAQRLHLAGMADGTARLLVRDELRRGYLARQRELIGAAEPAEFWRSASAAADREKQAALRRLARDNQSLLTELYGADEAVLAERERERRAYGPLPDAKLERIDRIHEDYGEMADDVRARAGGALLAVDRETLELLEQERRKDVAAVLTPEELEVYDLQTSAMARTLRARLAAFAPSEREFRSLFELERQYEARAAKGETPAAAELEKGIRAALGDVRYVEYRKTQDPQYRLAARIAERFGLPLRRAGEVHSLAESTQARLRELRDDRSLVPAAAHDALVQLARESGERLTALLGSEGADLYRQTSAGAWLRALERAAVELAPPLEAVAAPVEPEPPAAGETGPAEPPSEPVGAAVLSAAVPRS